MNKKVVYLLLSFIAFIIIVICFYLYILHREKEMYETVNYEFQSNWVKKVYDAYPNLFEFDSNGVCKITVEKMHTMQSEIGNYIEHDKYGNMCVGYFIISKSGENIEVDSSHICDMINY